MKKAVMFVLFVIVLSSFVVAKDEVKDCSGFFGSIGCFLFNIPTARQ